MYQEDEPNLKRVVMIFNILTINPFGIGISGKMPFKQKFRLKKSKKKKLTSNFLGLKYHFVLVFPTTKYHSILV